MLAMIKSLFSRAGGTSADSLNRSPGSLDTSRGPECGVSRFGVAQTPGLIIDHPTRLRYPAYDLSKNLPVILPVYQKDAVGQRLPFATRALSGWYVPSPDLINRLWVYLNGRNAEYSGRLASTLVDLSPEPDREEKGLGLT